MANIITAQQLFYNLTNLFTEKQIGYISFNLADISVKINTTDIVGGVIQAWVKQYLISNDIFFSQQENTQAFPDFFLDDKVFHKSMLEIKAFNYNATPAFDIANFESYCSSIKEKPYHLDADYLIFGYLMNDEGDITIKKIWLNKIWQIAGTSKRFPLKTQVKRDMIYNIRPNTDFKVGNKGPFKSKEDFLLAVYKTLLIYKGEAFAINWKDILSINYRKYYNTSLPF